MGSEGGQIRRRAVAAAGTASLVGAGLLVAAGASHANVTSSQSPQQIVQAAGTAVKHAKGYEEQAVLHETSGTDRVILIDGGAGHFDMRIAEPHGVAFRFILVGHKAYMKASLAFWKAQENASRQAAHQLASKWYKVPASEFKKTEGSLGALSRSELAQCIRSDNGTLSNAGTATVDGHQAVLIKEAGGQPGTTPETVAIAASGQPYPLRITVTGPTRAGGRITACNEGKASKATGTVKLSHWNSPPAVKAPLNAITIPKNG